MEFGKHKRLQQRVFEGRKEVKMRQRRELYTVAIICAFFLQAIWNWIKHNAEEFAKFQRSPTKKLSGKTRRHSSEYYNLWCFCLEDNKRWRCFSFSALCDNLFEILVSFAESTKRKAAVWPLQIMLLMLSPVSSIGNIHRYLKLM